MPIQKARPEAAIWPKWMGEALRTDMRVMGEFAGAAGVGAARARAGRMKTKERILTVVFLEEFWEMLVMRWAEAFFERDLRDLEDEILRAVMVKKRHR